MTSYRYFNRWNQKIFKGVKTLSEIEKAIKDFTKALNAFNTVCVKALQKKQEREKGCGYCKTNKSLYFDKQGNNPNLKEVYIEGDGNLSVTPYLCDVTETIQIKLNFCPMCGRDLRGENDG